MRRFASLAALLLLCSFSPALAAGPLWPPNLGWPPSFCCGSPAVVPGMQPAKLQVVDQNGSALGNVVGGSTSNVTVAFTLNGHEVVLLAQGTSRPNALFGTTGVVNFASDDCSGQAFMRRAVGVLIPTSSVTGPEMRVWVPADPNAAPALGTVQSFLTVNSVNCEIGPETIAVVPAIAIGDLASLFTPPFKLLFQPVQP